MVATLVLEASAERRVSSSLTWGTKFEHIAEQTNGGEPMSSMLKFGEFSWGMV